ncbi:uncharacterized protein C4orf17 homolog isoform X1 [Lepisosteus oculatus]|uniref:uncharacterized protein C4orf17 homolog isoform X1 n=1 Tax=Lepisosteus oculatus TaxID=7918 RepID=UPI0035F50621
MAITAGLHPIKRNEAFKPLENLPVLAQASPRRTFPAGTPQKCELSKVSLKVGKKTLNSQPCLVLLRQHSMRFGAQSSSPFFCRNNPHPRRVRHMKGLNDIPICTVNDEGYGQTTQYCLGKPMSPEKYLILQCKIPSSAMGTPTSCTRDTISGLQLFPFKEMDLPSLQLLSEAWREELRDLAEKAGLLNPTKPERVSPGSGTASSTRSGSQQSSPLIGRNGSREEEVNLNQELLIIDMLCQILQTDTIAAVQHWLLTAGQREKELVLNIIRAAIGKEGFHLKKSSEENQVVLVELESRSSVSRSPSIYGAPSSRLYPSQILSCDSGKTENSRKHTERSSSATTQDSCTTERQTNPRTLTSPSICNLTLNKKVVFRYSKKLTSPHDRAAAFQALRKAEECTQKSGSKPTS